MKKETYTKNYFICAGAFISCFLWGSAFPSIKIGYMLFNIASKDAATQVLFAGIRFFLAGLLTILYGSLMAKKILIPKPSSWGKVCKLSLFQTIGQYIFFYIGLAHTTGVRGSIITGLNTFIAIFVSSVLYKQESLTLRKIIGCICGFAGIILINLGSSQIGGSYLAGDICVLISATCYAFSSVYLKKYASVENTVVLSGYQFLLGGIFMIIFGFAFGGRITYVTSSGLLILLYLAFISATAYTIWAFLLKYNPVSKVAVYGFFNPVFGVILSSFLLSEGSGFSFSSIFALIFVCLGIFIVNHSA